MWINSCSIVLKRIEFCVLANFNNCKVLPTFKKYNFIIFRILNINSIRLPSPDPIENEPVEEDTFFMTGANKFLKTVSVKRQDGEGLPSSFDKNENSTFDKKGLCSAAGINLPGNRRERRAKLMGRDHPKTKPPKMNLANGIERFAQPFQKKIDRGFNNAHNNQGFKNKLDSNDRNVREFPGNNNKNMKGDSKFKTQGFSNKSTGITMFCIMQPSRLICNSNLCHVCLT